MDGPRVTVSQGELLGKLVDTTSGQYYSFQGVPYAKPPLGSLRFKPPVEAEAWEGVRDATTEGNSCPQLDFASGEYSGGEDCLYLNVYTSALPADDDQLPLNKPVIVFLHGGGFLNGSGNSDMFGPEYLVAEDVVLVTVNYRIGPLGFLCLHIKDAPGNAGLRDQILALKWVKHNIAQFGGDSDNVTFAGQSAGAATISQLTTSPASDNLFHKILLTSGSCFNDWAIEERPLYRAYNLARSLGCDSSDVEEVLAFLHTVTPEELIRHTDKTFEEEDSLVYVSPFVPVVEKPHDGIEPVLLDNPVNLIKKGAFRKLPIFIGYNSIETARYYHKITSEKGFRDDFRHLIPREFELEVNSTASVEVWNKMKHFYFGTKHLGAETIKESIQLTTDTLFSIGINKYIDYVVEYGNLPVFFYHFGYYGTNHIHATLLKSLGLVGAAHLDDLPYIFHVSLSDRPKEMNIADARVKERFVSFWTNFAKYSNPTPSESDLIADVWLPVTKTNKYYMNIDHDIVLGTEPDKERIHFWKDLFDKHALKTGNRKIEDAPAKRMSIQETVLLVDVMKETAAPPASEQSEILEEPTEVEEEVNEVVDSPVVNVVVDEPANKVEPSITVEPANKVEHVQTTKSEHHIHFNEVEKTSEPLLIKVEEYNGHAHAVKVANGVDPNKKNVDIIRANDPPEDDLPKNIGVNKFINFFEKLGNKN